MPGGEAFKPSRAKDDPTDAELAIDFLLRHPERFAPLRPHVTMYHGKRDGLAKLGQSVKETPACDAHRESRPSGVRACGLAGGCSRHGCSHVRPL